MGGSTQKPHTIEPGSAAASQPGTRGWCIRLACELEASAPKPGNVHPGMEFPDLSHAELVAAGAALAPAFEAAPRQRLGATIRAAVVASRRVTRSNANLGIVLVAAPLATVPEGEPPSAEAVARVLTQLVPADALDCWTAIAEARPGGMGRRDHWDVAAAPPNDLFAAMQAAADHDQIARLWTRGYQPLFAGPVADLERDLVTGHDLGDAIVLTFLRQLAREPDSLIARKHGPQVADAVSERAAAVISPGSHDWRSAARAFERDVVAGHGLPGVVAPPGGVRPGVVNPGTTADLVAGALYILLATARLQALVGPKPVLGARVLPGVAGRRDGV